MIRLLRGCPHGITKRVGSRTNRLTHALCGCVETCCRRCQHRAERPVLRFVFACVYHGYRPIFFVCIANSLRARLRAFFTRGSFQAASAAARISRYRRRPAFAPSVYAASPTSPTNSHMKKLRTMCSPFYRESVFAGSVALGGCAVLGADHPRELLQGLEDRVQDVCSCGVFFVDRVMYFTAGRCCRIQPLGDEVDHICG